MERVRKRRFKFRYLILGAILFAALVCIGFFARHLIRAHRKAERYRAAIAALDRGEQDKARNLLLNCIREDRNNEQAIVKLAELFEHQGRYRNAMQLYFQAFSLNAFNYDYAKSEIRMIARCCDFSRLRYAIDQLPESERSNPGMLLLRAFADYRSGRERECRELFQTLSAGEKRSQPLASLLELYFNSGKMPEAKFVAGLRRIAQSSDPVASFDALLALGRLHLLRKQPGEAEKSFVRAAELNPEIGLELLGDFYYYSVSLEKAVPVYEKLLSRGGDADVTVRLGEAFAALGRRDGLRRLAESCRRGSKRVLQAGYYLDALAAALDGDDRKLVENLRMTDGAFKTPGASMLAVYVAVKEEKFELVRKELSALRGANLPEALRLRLRRMVLPYVVSLTRAGELDKAGELADLIQDAKRPDLLLLRLIVGRKTASGADPSAELRQAFKFFPDDPYLLELAASSELRSGRYRAALDYVRRNIGGGRRDVPVRLQEAAALEGMKKIAESEQVLVSLRRTHAASEPLLNALIDFCVRRRREKTLARLVSELENAPAALEHARRFALIELALLRGDRKTVLRLLDEAKLDEYRLENASDVRRLFRAAYLLAEADRNAQAIKLYLRIEPHYAAGGLLDLNLAELYAAEGESHRARERAERIYLKRPEWNAARECYAARLGEAGSFEQVRQILSPLAASGKLSERGRRVYSAALGRVLDSCLTLPDDPRVEEVARELLRLEPGNTKARDALKKRTDGRKVRKNGGR